MFLLYAKKEFSAPVFDYIKTVKTEKELEEWLEIAVDFFEGIAWMKLQEGQNAEYRFFELDKKNRTVDSNASYTYEKHGEKIKEVLNFYVDEAKKIRIMSQKYAEK